MSPGWVPRVSTGPARTSAPEWAPLHGDIVLPGPCSRGGFPWGHIFLNHTSTCCGFGSSTGWISALPRTFIGCRGTTSRTMVFITGCRNISALVPGAAPLPPSSLTFLTAELFLSQNHTPLFPLILHNCFSALSISGSTDAVLDRK